MRFLFFPAVLRARTRAQAVIIITTKVLNWVQCAIGVIIFVNKCVFVIENAM